MAQNRTAHVSNVRRRAAFAMHARHSAQETTKAGTAAFLARFEREVDPDGKLDPEERAKRAMFARRAYFSKLVSLRHARRRTARSERAA